MYLLNPTPSNKSNREQRVFLFFMSLLRSKGAEKHGKRDSSPRYARTCSRIVFIRSRVRTGYNNTQKKNDHFGHPFFVSGKRDSSPRYARTCSRIVFIRSRVRAGYNNTQKKDDQNGHPFFVSGKRDSNSRPQPWQGCALPTELFPRFATANIQRFFYSANFFRKKIYSILRI